ncbi:MAG: twin-arginine translocation signal domain-containing protein [Actinobacteria bacterium]|nr:twin-arginine translocation signal domain-containing protein [Actinomycetota bacterium]
MTLALRPRRTTATDGASDLSPVGVHRDPTNHDPIAAGGFAQRLVHRISAALNRSTPNRRSFLTRTAVVGSALAVGPLDFILKPGTAYGYLCGTCSDGWTAFCCTINSGRNSCPAGSFVAGWWKADNAAYCCGSARYIIDCNATCPTQCSCRCAGDSCDGRRTCCNQFRYGQCHTEIACYGPVVCRVATCVVPWQYDPTCTTTSRTDNRTVDHGAPCLGQDCDTPIQRKYLSLGGPSSYLGSQTSAERAVRGSRPGRVARYERGSIYWSSATGAHPLWGRLLTKFDAAGGIGGTLGYPKTDILTTPDERAKYTIFQYGRVYSMQEEATAYLLTNAFASKHQQAGGVRGAMGYPISDARPINTARGGTVQTFERGRIYQVGSSIRQTHGSLYDCHQANGGVGGVFGYPSSDVKSSYAGGRVQYFERGIIWSFPPEDIPGQGLHGVTLFRFVYNGGVDPRPGYYGLGYPTQGTTPVGDGRGTYAVFQRGHIYGTDALGAFQVHGGVLDLYLSLGGPTGDLGYPTSELDPPSASGIRSQQFEHGRIDRLADGTIVRA